MLYTRIEGAGLYKCAAVHLVLNFEILLQELFDSNKWRSGVRGGPSAEGTVRTGGGSRLVRVEGMHGHRFQILSFSFE